MSKTDQKKDDSKKEKMEVKEAIPKVLYMCDKTLDNIKKYSSNWTKLNPDYKIKLYDNELCEKFLNDVFGKDFVTVFNFIKDGPIKADFWRVCLLYHYGGIYIDADIEPLVPLKDYIDPAADFVTCTAYSPRHKFNPNFIAAKAGDSYLKDCIQMYLTWYEEKKTYNYFDWSIMNVFTNVIQIPNFKKVDNVYEVDGKNIQLLKECEGKEFYDDHNVYHKVRVFNNRYKNYDAGTHKFKDE